MICSLLFYYKFIYLSAIPEGKQGIDSILSGKIPGRISSDPIKTLSGSKCFTAENDLLSSICIYIIPYPIPALAATSGLLNISL